MNKYYNFTNKKVQISQSNFEVSLNLQNNFNIVYLVEIIIFCIFHHGKWQFLSYQKFSQMSLANLPLPEKINNFTTLKKLHKMAVCAISQNFALHSRRNAF